MTKKRIRVIQSLLLILFAVLFSGWLWVNHGATELAQQKAESAQVEQNYLYFASKTEHEERPLLIFYPGAFVDAESYSPWASRVAANGYDVAIVKMPLNLAVLAPDRGKQLMEAYPKKKVVFGGHSLGGVMSSRLAAESYKKNGRVVGVFFLASYPDKAGSLNGKKLPVLSITGTEDQVLDEKAFTDAKEFLPKQTTYEVIQGGNHAGFGSYGKQRGDGKAKISGISQQQQIASELVSWLEQIN